MLVVVLGGLLYEARIIPVGQLSQISILVLLIGCMLVGLVQAQARKNAGSARRGRLMIAPLLPAGISVSLSN